MARQPSTKTSIAQTVIPAVSDANNDQAEQALAVLNESTRSIVSNYNLSSANPEVLLSEIRGFQASATEAMFAIGVRLLVLHQVVPHGEWGAALESLGMDQRTARRIVQVTIKFADPRKTRSDKLLGLGKGKLLELLVLDDEAIDVLDEGGQLGELDLDDIAGMSPTELRHHVRELRYEGEAKDALIAKKDQKLNKLTTDLTNAKKFKPTEDSLARTGDEQAALDEIRAATLEAEAGFRRLALVANSVLVEGAMSQAINDAVRNDLNYICQSMADIAVQVGIEIDLTERITPSWMQG